MDLSLFLIAQHYYGQTVRWDLTNGTAAATPQQQTRVQHVDNGRFKIFVAEGTHATYFTHGRYDVIDSEDPDHPDKRLGKQIQYAAPEGVAHEDAGNVPVPIDVWRYPAEDFLTWEGRWGYKDTPQTATFTTSDRDGPNGPALRFGLRSDGTPLVLIHQRNGT